MCEKCHAFNEKLYPDMGEGSSLEVTSVDDTIISPGHRNGMRFAQERDVTYMGMDGVESRHEIHCVYIPWHLVLAAVQEMMECYAEGAPELVKIRDFMKYSMRVEMDDEEGDDSDPTL